MTPTRIVAHKDTDGQCSSTLYQEAEGIKEPIYCPAEFGWMRRTTQLMFDMNPKWEAIYEWFQAAKCQRSWKDRVRTPPL